MGKSHMWQKSRAVEIRHCSELREVALEGNRLVTPVLDLRALAQLRALQLFGNPLRYLSLANVRIRRLHCLSWALELPVTQCQMRCDGVTGDREPA